MTPRKTGAAAIACGLALTMCLGMGFASTASAATVTFDKDLQGQTVSGRSFNAYKLATMSQPTADGDVTYTFVDDNVRNAVKTTLKAMGKNVDKTGTDVALSGVIAGLTNSEKVAFASKLTDTLKQSTDIHPTPINGNSATLDDYGYYVIEETTAAPSVVKAAPFLLQVKGQNVNTTLKSAQPSINKDIVSEGKKDTKYDDTSIGQDVKFELNDMKVPNTYGYDTFTYTINDLMSNGLTFTKAQLDAMTVTIDGKPVDKSNYTVLVNGKDSSTMGADWSVKGARFQIKFNDTYFIGTYGDAGADGKLSYTQNPEAGKPIKVNFSATLNEDAKTADPENNTVNLTYTNKPGTTTDSTDHKVYVYTYGIDVNKTFSDKKDLFSQVEFGLTGANDEEIYVTGSNGNYTVVKKGTAGAVSAASGLKLTAQGELKIKGFDAGTYTLTETKCPDGYEPAGGKTQTITITPNYGTNGADGKTGKKVTVAQDTNKDGYVDASVVNKPGSFHLPETGAAGMILLPMIGIGVMAGAAITLRRKARSDK